MDNYKNLEFIDPSRGFLYVLLAEYEVKENMLGHENWLVIPDGAELMTAAGKEFVFWKGNGQYSWHTENSNEWEKAGFGLSDLESYLDEYSKIVWERNKQVEKDPALISGADVPALIKKGESVQFRSVFNVQGGGEWQDLNLERDEEEFSLGDLINTRFEWRLKPQTIKLELELPKPFEPEEDCHVYILDDGKTDGYRRYSYEVHGDKGNTFIGIWKTEDEIKQVVAQLRKIRGAS